MITIVNAFKKFIRNESGLVTIEWVGIAAVAVLAAVVISAAIMHQTEALGSAINVQQDSVSSAMGTNVPSLDFTPAP